jgi:hypothetical protein
VARDKRSALPVAGLRLPDILVRPRPLATQTSINGHKLQSLVLENVDTVRNDIVGRRSVDAVSENNVAAVGLVEDCLGDRCGSLEAVLGVLSPDDAAGVSSLREDREEEVIVLDNRSVAGGKRKV